MARNMLLILCLIAWKEPMGTPNCCAVLHVGQDHLEEGITGADGLERQPDRRLLDRACDPARRGLAAGLAEGAVVGTKTRSRVTAASGRLASSECTGVRPASAAGTTNAPMPSPAWATTTISVVPSAAMTPTLVPSRTQPSFGRLGGHGDVVQRPGPRVVGQRHRPGDRA